MQLLQIGLHAPILKSGGPISTADLPPPISVFVSLGTRAVVQFLAYYIYGTCFPIIVLAVRFMAAAVLALKIWLVGAIYRRQ